MHKINIEHEFRTYLPFADLLGLISKFRTLVGWHEEIFHETTIMLENPNPSKSFYRKEIDGRLRFRTYKKISNFEKIYFNSLSKLEENIFDQATSYGKVSWKRRMKNISKDMTVNTEEEIEYEFAYKDIENSYKIFSEILQCPKVSSYEKIRIVYAKPNCEISLNLYPFGISLEIESNVENYVEEINNILNFLQISGESNSKLSCDDKYFELCKENKIQIKKDILFSDIEMPKIK